MNRTTLLLICLICTANTPLFARQSTDKGKIFVFNEEWQPTTVKKAVYLTQQRKVNDTCWQLDVYNFYGPLIRMERYKDKEGKIGHGKFAYYNKQGRLDSICDFANGLAHGKWTVFNDTGRVVYEKVYEAGRLISERDVLKEVKKDTVADKNEKESKFPGELEGWGNYLRANLRYPQRAIDKDIQGRVNVMFIVDSDGSILDPIIFKSVEYSLDEESLRIINKSPKWVPAYQFGKNVKSYMIQPVIYRFK